MVESETLVVVPTYNEAGTIGAIVNGVAELGYSLLVVDDGSPDGTADIAEQLAGTTSTHVMRRTSKDGLGAAYRAGFAWGLDRDAYSVICQMDADLSHDPADLSRLVAAVRQRPGVAIGSRYVQGGSTVGWARSRELLSRGGNRYMRVCTGVGVADMTSGFRAWDADVIRGLALCETVSEGYSFQLENTARAWFGGAPITELPITFTERAEGESKMSSSIIVEAMWRVPAMAWHLRRRPPGTPVRVPARAAVELRGERS
jgi:dolichol-phosphate mannosyltransferase